MMESLEREKENPTTINQQLQNSMFWHIKNKKQKEARYGWNILTPEN